MIITDAMQQRIGQLAQAYLPGWRFDPGNPDFGTVVALLYGQMLEESESRLALAHELHRVGFLNMLEPVLREPAEAARSYVEFFPVGELSEPIYIPKGTQLAADRSADGRILFETAHDLAVISAGLDLIVATGTVDNCDRIVTVMDAARGDSPRQADFRSFHPRGENRAAHSLSIGVGAPLDERSDLDLTVRLEAENPAEAVAVLTSEQVRWSVDTPQGELPLDRAEPLEGGIRLVKEAFAPQRTLLGGRECHVVTARFRERFSPVELSGLRVETGGSGLVPDAVWCGGMEQSAGRCLPFGSPMEIYAEWGLESREAFTKRGALVTLEFRLEHIVLEQGLPITQQELDYRVVMRKPVDRPPAAPAEVRADYVVAEYLSASGWRRLLEEESVSLLFRGEVKGEVSLRFPLPADMAEHGDPRSPYRVRFRLLRAENLYALPCNQLCPVAEELRISYDYAASPALPEAVVIRNNHETDELADRLAAGRPTQLFYSRELRQPALYLGFDSSPRGVPVSLYLEVENHTDTPVDFAVEYRRESGFSGLQALDGTGGLLHSGTLRLQIPDDIAPGALFGEERHWLRIRMNNREQVHPAALPRIRGIWGNMALVENAGTRTEYFYADDPSQPLHIQLGEGGLSDLTVWVNESDPQGESRWVPWRETKSQRGGNRCYRADPVLGTLDFDATAFAGIRLNPEDAAVKAQYRCYKGSAANVPANAIDIMVESIRQISGASNPLPAYGGQDQRTENSVTRAAAAFLSTRNRAVTAVDFERLILETCRGVGKVRCLAGVNLMGHPEPEIVTVAVLLREYRLGGHIFSTVKEKLRETLLSCSDLQARGKTLLLSQPHFVTLSVRLWMSCRRMEDAYALQRKVQGEVQRFIDPLEGGFSGCGWEIGQFPTKAQLLAYLKMTCTEVSVNRMIVTAGYAGMEFVPDEDVGKTIGNPFATAVNGSHIVYLGLE